MVNFNGFDVPNMASEMLLKQYSHVASIVGNKHIDDIDKWKAIFKFWKMPEEQIMTMKYNYLKEKSAEWQASEQKKVEVIREIEIDGYLYTSHNAFDENGDLDPDVMQVAIIKKAINKENYICELIAALFHREDLSVREHYTAAHIKQKAKLFGELNAEFSVSYIALFGKYLVTEAEKEKAKKEQATAPAAPQPEAKSPTKKKSKKKDASAEELDGNKA